MESKSSTFWQMSCHALTNLTSKFDHPRNVCTSYAQHMWFSLEMSYHFALGSIKAIIHALLPDYYVTSTTDTSLYIQQRLEESGCRNE